MTVAARTAGLICIFCACQLTGIELERRMKLRWIFLRDMQELLTWLEKEMTYHRTPIRESFAYAAERCRPPLSGLLAGTVGRIGKEDGTAFEQIWSEEARTRIPGWLLTDEEHHAVREAAAALCNMDTVMQKVLLAKQAAHFRQMSEEALANYQEKGRLYRRLSQAAGIFAVILLL